MVLAHDISKGDRTRDVKTTENITFETMLLSPNTLQGLKDSGFYKPSPIQLCGIPIGKCGFDLLLEAKSGTGKTAVFSIIALEKLDFTKGLQVVILTPTREIAAQICDVLKQIGARYEGLQIEVVMGGLPFQEDIDKFQKPVHIVVGSPGRLKHLIQKEHINTSSVRLLVLDEADKLMEKIFQSDIRFIHTALPKQKQVIMSSATYSDTAKVFINNFVQNANHVCPDSDTILLGVTQKVTFVKFNSNIVRQTQDRFKELLHILVKVQFKQCLVFCNYQTRVSEIHKLLKKEKWPSEQLYGQQEQLDRLDALKTLQQYKCRILVSTDLASRGIDASNIDLVINFEPPYDWQTYLHRIGRAGRFGSYGLAVTILSEGKEQEKFKHMVKSMELSINLHNLWTDEEFNVDNTVAHVVNIKSHNERSTPTDLHEDVSYQAVWNILNSERKEINSIESFENLCQSQVNSDLQKIDTFSDFMHSFKNIDCQDNNEDSLYKHIEMTKKSSNILISIEKCMVQPSLTKDNNNVFFDEVKNTANKNRQKYTTEINEENNNYTNGVSKNMDEVICDNTKNINVNFIEKPIIESKPSDHIKWKKIKTGTVYKKNRNNVRKNKKCEQSSQAQCNIAIPNNKYDLDSNDDESSGSEPNPECNNSSSPKSTDENHSREESNKKENRSYNSMQHSYGADFKFQNDDYDHDNVTYQTRKSKKEKQNEHITKGQIYYNWYNKLKMNMLRIEQAIYIDEMSRL